MIVVPLKGKIMFKVIKKVVKLCVKLEYICNVVIADLFLNTALVSCYP